MEYLIPLLTILLSGVFLTAGLAKLIDFAGARKAAEDFGVPEAMSAGVMSGLIFVEISVAICLLFEETKFAAAVAACVLLFVFFLATARLVFKGESPDCHCFGQLSTEPVGKSALVRNAVLLVLAVGISVLPGNLPFESAQIVTVITGFALSAFLIASLLIALELRKRFDSIEERLRGVEKYSALLEMRESGGDPSDGLPVGTLVPDVQIADLDGGTKSVKDLIVGGVPALLLFVSPDCVPCAALAKYFPDWEEILEGKVRLVLISSEDAEINIEKFGEANRSRIYLQDETEVSDALKARWTPTAVLVGKDSRIASTIAAGDVAIRDLIRRISETTEFESPLYIGEDIDGISEKFGSKVPGFELERLDGTRFSESDLQGQPTLVVFWSLTCQYCTEMLNEMLLWKNGTDSLKLAILADGDEGKLRDTGLGEKLIIDEKYKVSEHFGMFGTPSAVIVDENGVVVSETVQGDRQIELLSNGVLSNNP